MSSQSGWFRLREILFTSAGSSSRTHTTTSNKLHEIMIFYKLKWLKLKSLTSVFIRAEDVKVGMDKSQRVREREKESERDRRKNGTKPKVSMVMSEVTL